MTNDPAPLDLERVKEKIRLDLRVEPEEIARLVEEVETLRREVAYLRKSDEDEWYMDVIAKLTEALEFYAVKKNYCWYKTVVENSSKVEADKGQIAREALEKK